jgi:hypothetical protein
MMRAKSALFQGDVSMPVSMPKIPLLMLAGAAAMLPSAVSAKPECTKLAASVNDYGKDGPTRDAKTLLDRYIGRWAQEKGIKTFKIGKKDVTCELFLNAIVFDEYTCQATAEVCWTPAKSAPKRTVAR